jgi:dCMP deaminase
MRYLVGDEIEEAQKCIQFAANIAKKSKCRKSRRGAVVVKDGKIIGSGYNNAPLDEVCKSCLREGIHDNSRVELCYGVHAEQNAIVDALKRGHSLEDSRLYHIKVKNNEIKSSDDISCTVCSKLILNSGISEVVLLHTDGFGLYSSREFNEKSFEYFK